MGISVEEVRKVAMLARLLLDDEELQAMSEQLTKILDYMELLRRVETSNVEPLAHPLELVSVFRPDQLAASLPREQALACAPRHDGQCYLVPAVLGEL